MPPAHDTAADPTPRARRTAAGVALYGALFVALFGVVAVTIPDYGLTWDEPYYFWAQERQRAWLAAAWEDPAAALGAAAVAAGWNADPYHNPHPPFYKVVANLCWLAAGSPADPIDAYRLAPALFFAAAGCALCALVRRARGTGVALAAAALWATTPRVFANGHFAATDTPMTFFAVATALAFLAAVEQGERRPWVLRAVLLGLLFGAAFATKFTALLLPVPLVLWALLHREGRAWRVLLVAGAVAAPVAVLLTPYWWHDPLGGVLELVRVSTSRRDHTPINVVYFGRDYLFASPWTQPLVMVAVATPLTLWLPAAGAAVAAAWQRLRDRARTLWLLAAAVPIAAVMLPNAPNHDGVRLFLPAFPFLAALAADGLAAGAAAVAGVLRRTGASLARLLAPGRAAAVILTAAVVAQGLATAAYHPFELSYYNGLIGGLRGAARQGMEVTYWLEVLTPEVLAGVEAALPPGAWLDPVVGDPFYFHTLQRYGRLRRDLVIVEGAKAPFHLVVSRVSVLGAETLRRLDDLPGRSDLLYELRFDGVSLVRLVALEEDLP